MPVKATKNGYDKTFSDLAWKNLPKDKYGWTAITEQAAPVNSVPIPMEIIQKKMVAGAKDIKPEPEIKPEIKQDDSENDAGENSVPPELIAKVKKVQPKKVKNDLPGKK